MQVTIMHMSQVTHVTSDKAYSLHAHGCPSRDLFCKMVMEKTAAYIRLSYCLICPIKIA